MLAGCVPGKEIFARAEKLPEAPNIEARACADETKTGDVMMTIQNALARFPQDFSEAADIDAIYVCDELKSFGIPVPAAAIRMEGKTSIYVAVGSHRKIDVSFTHELFHALELKNPVDEEAWASINPYESYPFDTYAPGEVFNYTPNMTPAFEPGFVSDYARFSPMEDRAELFTALYSGRMIYPRERTAMLCDPFLMEKAAFLKDYLGFPDGVRDNLFIETEYTCRLYSLSDPASVRIGPSEDYPSCNLKAGQLLADSGFEKDDIKMLYDVSDGYKRIYAKVSAVEPLDRGVTISLCASPK